MKNLFYLHFLLSDKYFYNLQVSASFKSCLVSHNEYVQKKYNPSQLFLIDIQNSSRLANIPANYLKTTNLKPISSIRIIWHWTNPLTLNLLSFCLNVPVGNITGMVIHFKGCNKNNVLETSNPFISRRGYVNTLILERTVLSGSPIRHGITIGKMPSWSDKY